MLYIFSLLYIIVKGLAFIINNEILFYLTQKNIFFAIILFCAIILCKKRLRYKRVYPYLVDHIMQYRFKSREDFYYSRIIICSTIIGYLMGITYLRWRAFNNPIDLTVINSSIQKLYMELPFGIFCYNIIIFLLLSYVFILSIKLIKKRINIHVTKMHFYLMSFEKYLRIHRYFNYHLSVDAVFIDKLSHYYKFCVDYIVSLYLFGYYKAYIYRYMKHECLPAKTRRYIWTLEEKQIYDSFTEKRYYFPLRNILDQPLNIIFYHLHFIILICCISYDILYHTYVLTTTAKALPLLFIYQIYSYLSQFVKDKIIHEVNAEINTLYYHDVTYINDRLMFMDGEIYQRPNSEQIIKDFLKYEAAEFYWTRIKH